MILWSIRAFWYKGVAKSLGKKQSLKQIPLSCKNSSPDSKADFRKSFIWYFEVNIEQVRYTMTYLLYKIDYLIYIYIYKKKTYLLNRLTDRALYRVIILPPYSPGVPPWGVYVLVCQLPCCTQVRYCVHSLQLCNSNLQKAM